MTYALKGQLLRFLYESDLITRQNTIVTLAEADLREADLREADLSRVKGFTNDQLELMQAHSLEGATMPDGRSHKEWTATRSS